MGQALDPAAGSNPPIRIEGLSCSFGPRRVLSGIGFQVRDGEFVGILGPNGCGKTTLLRCIAGLHAPDEGDAFVRGENVRALAASRLARTLALQAQDADSALGYRVSDVIGMGRLAHRQGFFSAETAQDAGIVADCMRRLGVEDFADRAIETLSGGERQRVMIARALAQQPSILLLDEPTNHLDVRHRFEVMEVVRTLGITVIATLHDIEFAARICDRIILLSAGRIVADALPEDALSAASIREVYGVAGSVDRHPATGQMRIDLQPLPEARP